MYKKLFFIFTTINSLICSEALDLDLELKKIEKNLQEKQVQVNKSEEIKNTNNSIQSEKTGAQQPQTQTIEEQSEEEYLMKEKVLCLNSIKNIKRSISSIKKYIVDENSEEPKKKLEDIESKLGQILEKFTIKTEKIEKRMIKIKQVATSQESTSLSSYLITILTGYDTVLKDNASQNPNSMKGIASKLLLFILEQRSDDFHKTLNDHIKEFDSFQLTTNLINELVSILKDAFDKKSLQHINFEEHIKKPFIEFINSKLEETKTNALSQKKGLEKIVQQIIMLLNFPGASNLLEKKGWFGMLNVIRWSEEELLNWYKTRIVDLESFIVTMNTKSVSSDDREKLTIILEKIYNSLLPAQQDGINLREIKEVIYPEKYTV